MIRAATCTIGERSVHIAFRHCCTTRSCLEIGACTRRMHSSTTFPSGFFNHPIFMFWCTITGFCCSPSAYACPSVYLKISAQCSFLFPSVVSAKVHEALQPRRGDQGHRRGHRHGGNRQARPHGLDQGGLALSLTLVPVDRRKRRAKAITGDSLVEHLHKTNGGLKKF